MGNAMQCQWLCSQLDECHSIDMNAGQDRCFINTYACDGSVDREELVPDTDYDLQIKQRTENQRRQRRLTLDTTDPRMSTTEALRFKDIEFNSGGEFKLCLCDSDLLDGENEICDGPEDYTIEVGSVHATGLQCLLSNPKMARGTCEAQEYGGLRCTE